MHPVRLAFVERHVPHARRLMAALAVALVPAFAGAGLAAGAMAGGGIMPAWVVPVSPPYDGVIGSAHHLSFIAYPDTYSNWDMGDIAVAVKDAVGHTITGDTRLVVLSLNQNTQSGFVPVPQFSCGDGLSTSAVEGVATFHSCVASVDLSRLRITAAAVGLPAVAGRTFALSGPPTGLLVGFACGYEGDCAGPGPIAGAGRLFVDQPRAWLLDATGHRAWFTHPTQLTLAITPGTPAAGGPGTLTCSGGLTIAVPAQGRWLAFDGCAVDATGQGYRLTATSSEGFKGTSSSFDVLARGQPAQLAFLSAPGGISSRNLGDIRVGVVDAWGDVVPTDSRTVRLREFASTWRDIDTFRCVGGAIRPAVSGVATFTSCTEPTFGHYQLFVEAPFFSLRGQWYEVANLPPTLSATGGNVEEGASITLIAYPDDPDGYPVTVAWDLDRNGTFETTGLTATFSAAGLTAPVIASIPVRATDDQGATADAVATVNVLYPFRGFVGLQPMPAFNTVKAGRQVAFRFSIGGDRGLDVLAADPYVKPIVCPAGLAAGSIQPATRLGGHLRYRPGIDQYMYTWRTDKTWSGTCVTFVLPLKGGYQGVNFAFE